ncbi:hypothetical protein [Enterococcus pingfangensis]|uniref:hypothetical protein n=1 Tax=Enterococcus pingfangensis TaxID=2559924 RepID=UPI0010F904C9|nr:hypothetical protein [Enterococcus pingfangensis]
MSERIIFSKYSNERASQFSVRTDIVKDGNLREVVKTALFPQGRQHIKHIYDISKKLEKQYEGSKFSVNRCRLEGESLRFEYLEDETLENYLNLLIRQNRFTDFEQLLSQYVDEFKQSGENFPFEMTPEFKKVFGNVEFIRHYQTKAVTNIDAMTSNTFLAECWEMIDYEWSFVFPIPIEFVVYRIVHYFTHTSPFTQELLSRDIYQKMGISVAEMEIFNQMEEHFQQIYLMKDIVTNRLFVPIREMHQSISPGSIEIRPLFDAAAAAHQARLQMFYRMNDDYSEENSSFKAYKTDQMVKMIFDLPDGTNQIRIDPAEHPCLVEDLKILDDDGNLLQLSSHNGESIDANKVLFLHGDPQFYLDITNIKKVSITFKISIFVPSTAANYRYVDSALTLINQEKTSVKLLRKEKEALMEKMSQVILRKTQEQQELQETVNHLDTVISNMRSTKVWKAYQKYLKLRNK